MATSTAKSDSHDHESEPTSGFDRALQAPTAKTGLLQLA